MSKAAKALPKAGGTIAVGSAAIVGLSVAVTAAAAIVVLALIMAVCWTITDSNRSARLALLISATRGQSGNRAPPAALIGRPDVRRGPATQRPATQRGIR